MKADTDNEGVREREHMFPGFARVDVCLEPLPYGPKPSSLLPGARFIPQCMKVVHRSRAGEDGFLCARGSLRFELLHRHIFRLLLPCQLNANAWSKHRTFLGLVRHQFQTRRTLQG